MARKASPTLTEAEMRLMRIVWKLGSCTVNDVVEALPDDENLAYSTVLTTMRILESKGYLSHEKEGRAFVYSPEISPGEVRKGALQFVLNRFFDNSPSLLMLNLLKEDSVDEDDLEAIKKLIDDADNSGNDND